MDTAVLEAVNRRLRRGTLLAGGAVVALAVSTTLPFWDVLGIPFFYLLLPAIAFAQLPLIDAEEMDRMTVYAGSVVAILGLGAVGLALGWRIDGLEGLGLGLPPRPQLIGWTLGLTAAGLVVIGVFTPLDRTIHSKRGSFLIRLLPRTRREKSVFAGLSAAAGLGEELAYRGYAFLSIQLLGPGAWAAAGISSAAFGFLHIYQGPMGVVRTGVIGFILAVPVVVTGSLIPSMLAHALIDLIAGLVLGPWLIRKYDLDSGSSADEGPLVPPSAPE